MEREVAYTGEVCVCSEFSKFSEFSEFSGGERYTPNTLDTSKQVDYISI